MFIMIEQVVESSVNMDRNLALHIKKGERHQIKVLGPHGNQVFESGFIDDTTIRSGRILSVVENIALLVAATSLIPTIYHYATKGQVPTDDYSWMYVSGAVAIYYMNMFLSRSKNLYENFNFFLDINNLRKV